MGAFSVIGGALGAYYWGPSIIAGAQAAWPYIVAVELLLTNLERGRLFGLYKNINIPKTNQFAYDYLSGLLTPLYSPLIQQEVQQQQLQVLL